MSLLDLLLHEILKLMQLNFTGMLQLVVDLNYLTESVGITRLCQATCTISIFDVSLFIQVLSRNQTLVVVSAGRQACLTFFAGSLAPGLTSRQDGKLLLLHRGAILMSGELAIPQFVLFF